MLQLPAQTSPTEIETENRAEHELLQALVARDANRALRAARPGLGPGRQPRHRDLRAAAHQIDQSFPAGERIDLQLIDAARRGDRAGFLELLRPARVFVGTTEKGPFGQIGPTDPAFPWDPVPVRGRASVLVYTSTAWRQRTGGSGGTAIAKFGELAGVWPDGGPDLVLNPASPISVTRSAGEVRRFADG